jgi:hypothetical protein
MATSDKIDTPTVRSEINRLGRDLFMSALAVSSQQISNVIKRGRFPECWLRKVEVECGARGLKPPIRSLYGSPISYTRPDS